MDDAVTLFEVGPRDGLQNEPAPIPAAQKIALIDALSACGFTRIEATSFVSPKWVLQMADAEQVLAGIRRAPGCRYAALTPNLRGFEAAVAARADEVAVFASASEGFSRNNINCPIDESLARFAPVMDAAHAAGVPVRGYVSCTIECPFDGPTPAASVLRVATALTGMGCYEVSLADTIGTALPAQVDAMLTAVLAELPPDRLAGHFHDTGGRAIENIAVCLERGLRTFDSAVAGLGGCPYAPGAPGNVATEKVADFLARQGMRTGIDRDALGRAVELASACRSTAGPDPCVG